VPPSAFDGRREQALAALLELAPPRGPGWCAAAVVSQHLQSGYGIRIHWRSLDAIFSEDPRLVARRKKGGRWEYQLLADGEREVSASAKQFLLIDPVKAVQAVKTVHEMLASLKGEVRLCDPYLDHTSIEHLCALAPAVPARVLSFNIKDAGRLKRTLAAAATEGRTFSIRVAPAGKLHDRYVIDDAVMYIIGTSLNGLGKKQAFLVRAGEDLRNRMIDAFEALWGISTPWP
jgi:hypothetical protein